jgi:hypothetical protein
MSPITAISGGDQCQANQWVSNVPTVAAAAARAALPQRSALIEAVATATSIAIESSMASG